MNFFSTEYLRRWRMLFIALCFSAASVAEAQVTNLSEYAFTAGTGSAYDMSSGATVLLGNNVDDGLSSATNIGFNFSIGGSSYSQFKANTNGYMTVGTAGSSSGCCGYVLTSLPGNDRPAIVPFSEDLHNGSDGYVSYKVFGSSPNRVLVVHWQTRQYPGSGQSTHTTMQARLYEGSNKIELWYGATGLTGSNPGGIGVIVNGSNYASVNSGSVSYSSASTSTFPSQNTMYSFTPCQANVAFRGNTSSGGTAKMSSGDTLLSGFQVMRGSAGTITPFELYNGTAQIAACSPRTYQYIISGTHAADYSISPSSGSLGLNGTSTPTITFRPGAVGRREATLTVRDDAGLDVTYQLHGTGTSRIRWSGDVNDGGTPSALDGDVLIDGIQVEFGSFRDFRPLIIRDVNTDPLETPPAPISYTLIDPIGNYSITPASTSILGGEQSVPVIRFTAQGIVGTQEATLIVTADGETRRYTLRAYNAAPGGRLVAEGSGEISDANPLFVDRMSCVGDQVVSIKVTAFNTGAGDFIIRGADIYKSDTVIQQGTPRYPMLRDNNGDPIPSADYFLSLSPGVSPKKNNARFDSLVVPERGSRDFYINLLPLRPGRRYGILYVNTNAFNLEDANVDGIPTRGTLRSAVFGRGIGAGLERPKPIVFGTTDVRETATASATIRNNGDCDLRIRKSELRFVSGDLTEFELVSVLPNTTLSGDSYLLAPGASDQITVRFTPTTYGSRRATIRLVTNDSTIGDGLVSDFGVLSLDVYGEGRTGLEARPAQLSPAVIDGESSFGAVFVENTSGGDAVIESITIAGATTEFGPDATRPWPTLPLVVRPAQSLNLWVKLTGDAAVGPGSRTAQMVIVLRGGDTMRIPLSGLVGSRTLAVAPANLFAGLQLQTGSVVRKIMTVTNTGSLPVRLNDPVLASTNPGDYEVTPLARRVLEPGQTEFLEVYYTPQTPGASSGTITFSGNQTNGDQVVMLGGEGMTIGTAGDPVGSSTRSHDGIGEVAKVGGDGALSVASVSPNPAGGTATISYRLAGEGTLEVDLYDVSGRLVSKLYSGVGTAGNGEVQVDLSTVSAGVYHLMLRQGGNVVTQRITVVK